MVHQTKTALQQLASRLHHQAAEVIHLRSIVAAQAERIARVQVDHIGPRTGCELVAGKEMPARERRTHDGGYFVDAAQDRKQRRRSDTLLPQMPLSELPMMKALLVAPKAFESKPRDKEAVKR